MPVHGVSDSIPKLLTDTEIFEIRAHLPRKRGWLNSTLYKLKILRQLQKVEGLTSTLLYPSLCWNDAETGYRVVTPFTWQCFLSRIEWHFPKFRDRVCVCDWSTAI